MTKSSDGTAPPDVPRFVQWMKGYGMEKLAKDLGVSPWTVQAWRRGALGQNGGAVPRPQRMAAILQLAKGHLKASDIYPNQKNA